MKVYKNFMELVGNTPLVQVSNYMKANDLKANILVKLEYFNPAGSAKDRIAKAMIEDAEAKGLLKQTQLLLNRQVAIQVLGFAQ